MSHAIDRFSVVHFLKGCFFVMEFALEPHLATPSAPALGLAICGLAPTGSLEVRIFTKGEVDKYHRSVPAGMFADGGLHEIAVSFSRESWTITYYLDQKCMSTQPYNDYGSGEMPTFGCRSRTTLRQHWRGTRSLRQHYGRLHLLCA